MFSLMLPDGKKLEFSQPVTAYEAALKIGARLAQDAIAAKVDGKLVDLSSLINSDCQFSVITSKSEEGIDIIRHSAAHLMAQAVKELFPKAKFAIGPTVEDGFYYDFYNEESFTLDDLARIEERMREIAKRDLIVSRKVLSREAAINIFAEKNEKYKVELIQELPADSEISVYQQGDFIDLCRGPHVDRTSKIKSFKVLKIAGVYWRGDAKNDVLQRIYGTAWATDKELQAYITRIEEAKKRDHRVLAKKLDLFHLQEEAPGLVFWHPNGWTVYQEIRKYITQKESAYGYQEVSTPIILDRVLWEKSGHWEKYAENMFITSSENRTYALKPMNCPGHIQIFKQGIKSYRDLPIRFSEFGSLHRNENSGTLHGLLRVRGFCQDDGHIFCTEDQIASEALAYIEQLLSLYSHFGFAQVTMRLSTRPAKRIGSDEIWDKAEQALTDALNNKKVSWQLAAGDGAFYGPKIDFHLRDCLGRTWQCGTLQLDFQMPSRLEAYYIDEHGNKKHPVMLHRAMLGTIERFMGILLEETAGNLPFWLAPVQVSVMNITDNQREYAIKIQQKLQDLGIRSKNDLRNEKIGYKIREHTLQKVPFMVILGDKEVAENKLAVRTREGKDLGSMTIEEFTSTINSFEKRIDS